MIYKHISLILTCLTLSACSGYISGKVYLDENDNSLADSSESGIAGARLTITMNQERIDEVVTNGNGFFRVKAGRLGRYCVSLDSESLEAAVSGTNFGRAMKAAGISFPEGPLPDRPAGNQPSGTACADMNGDGRCDSGCVDSNRDGVCDSDCADANHDGRCDEECVDSNSDGRCDNNCVDSNRDGRCDTDRCADANHDGRCDGQSDSAPNGNNNNDNGTNSARRQPPGWTQGGYCFTNNDYATDVDIPVGIDYSGANAAASTLPPQTCRAGASCEITIPIPRGCELNSMTFPEGLRMGSTRPRRISVSSSANLSKAANDDGSFSDTQSNSGRSAAPVIAPAVETLTFTIETDAGIPAGSSTATLAPTADCGTEVIALPNIVLNLVREVGVSVLLNMLNNPEPGREIDVEAIIENTGDGTISSGELLIGIPDGTSITSIDRECNNLGNRMLCPVHALEARGRLNAGISIDLPASPAQDTIFTITATFSSDELEEDITAAPIEFALSPNPPAAPAAPTPSSPSPAQNERQHAYININVDRIK